jgi:hypothetical protein
MHSENKEDGLAEPVFFGVWTWRHMAGRTRMVETRHSTALATMAKKKQKKLHSSNTIPHSGERIVLSPESFDEVVRLLNEPASPTPALRELLDERGAGGKVKRGGA